jgi:hypothetical protein
MKKLDLKLDDLAVETFTTTASVRGKGTIHALSGECGSSGGVQCICHTTPGTAIEDSCTVWQNGCD